MKNAVWKNWPRVGAAYRVRNRHGNERTSAYSVDGFKWFDSYKNNIDMRATLVRFHGGALDGFVKKSEG